jgi:hypothetical protein
MFPHYNNEYSGVEALAEKLCLFLIVYVIIHSLWVTIGILL